MFLWKIQLISRSRVEVNCRTSPKENIIINHLFIIIIFIITPPCSLLPFLHSSALKYVLVFLLPAITVANENFRWIDIFGTV